MQPSLVVAEAPCRDVFGYCLGHNSGTLNRPYEAIDWPREAHSRGVIIRLYGEDGDWWEM